MALPMLSSTPLFSFSRLQLASHFTPRKWRCFRNIPGPVQCTAAENSSGQTDKMVRRTGNYPASIWNHDFLQSLASDYAGEKFTRQLEKLKGDVKMMLSQVAKPLDQLELIDNLKRLGIHYHFDQEIKRILQSIYRNHNRNDAWKNGDLYATALAFRLLRQHGYHVPQDGFNIFMKELETGAHKNMNGILCLYEASYLSTDGEEILEEAGDFTRKILGKYLEQKVDQNVLTMLINHAMELPLHWRMPRLEARWFIDVYESSPGMNPILLELDKLDYNIVQAAYQEEIKHISLWWKNTRITEKLSFARDRLMENFLAAVGFAYEPQFGYCRRMLTRVNSLITIVDDIYDVYGTLEELELFTDAVERWDINTIEQLPEYMKIAFLALYNFSNGMAYDVLTEQDFHIISYLRKAWANLCKAYLVEMKWYHQGYRPSLEEYMDNAWISISGPVILVHAYFASINPIRRETLGCLERDHNLIRWASIILRLTNDRGTSSEELKRGDVPKYIQLYMCETGASEDDACKYVDSLIKETWKKLNQERNVNSSFSQTFVEIALNFARISQLMYQHGDGFGVPDRETKDRVVALFIEPISLTAKV